MNCIDCEEDDTNEAFAGIILREELGGGCSRPGCDGLGYWYPIFLVSDARGRLQPARVLIARRHCEAHRLDAEARLLLDEVFAMLAQGVPERSFSREGVRIEWVRRPIRAH